MVSVEVDSGPINNSNNFSTPSTIKESQKKIFDKERSISPSCADYIKKKEMFLYKMMNDGSNKAMLYFLEILMQSKIPISIEDLANRLAHKSFSEDMKKACGGGSVEGLKSFFLKYPSLFNVRKDGLVSSIDLDTQSIENEVVSSENGAESTTKKEEKKKSEKIYVSPAFRGEKVCCTNQGDVSISSTSGNQTAPSSTCCHCTNVNVNNFITASHDNIAKETEAVRFFQQRLIRREEKWVQIKSLAGHLSQANQEIRNLVGPQLEFKNFLLKHPQVFEIQGELVSLREIIPANSKKVKIQSKTSKTSTSGPNRRPKSLIMMTSDVQLRNNSSRPMMQAEMEINRRHSLSSAPVTPTLTGKSGQVVQCISTEGLCLSMSANEYRAVMYLRKVLEKKSVLTLSKLMQYLSIKAPEAIQNIIGWTRIELEEFISQHDIFFEMRAGGLFSSDSMSLKAQSCVSTSTNSSSGISSGQSNNNLGSNGSMIITNKKFHQTVNILITTGKKTEGSNRTLNNKSGRICHVAKLWGIIDLGKHEHVFFDKSLFRYVDDLQKHFQINELLYFNAILAPKESRAKWRAIQVWKECDRENLERMSGPISSHIIGDKLRNNSENMKSYQTEHHQEIYDMLNNAGCQSSIGDDTEFEGEMDDYDLMPLEHTNSRLDDILTSEVEDQINAILGPAKPNYRKINDYLTVTDEVWGLGTEEDLSYCGTISSELSNNASSQLNLGNDGQVTSTYIHEPLDESISTQKNSIGCQTLATGDIMASQLFHESMSKLV